MWQKRMDDVFELTKISDMAREKENEETYKACEVLLWLCYQTTHQPAFELQTYYLNKIGHQT